MAETLHFDVTTADFKEKVIDASHQAVIVVDFWAEWCGPCRMLGPVLEKIADSFNGRVLLAKVDVDSNPDLARMFQIQSIPAVKIFKNGEMVEEFMGAVPEPQIRAMLDPLAGSDADDTFDLAARMLADGRPGESEKLYDEILAATPALPTALIGKARALIARDDLHGAQTLLEKVDQLDKEHDEAAALLQSIEFRRICTESGDIGQCRQRTAENPGDLEALYRLGCCQAASDQYESALESFLGVVTLNAGYDGGKAREAMIAVFTILGPDSDITRDYRTRLARVLF